MQYFYQFYKIGTLSCHIQNIVRYIKKYNMEYICSYGICSIFLFIIDNLFLNNRKIKLYC